MRNALEKNMRCPCGQRLAVVSPRRNALLVESLPHGMSLHVAPSDGDIFEALGLHTMSDPDCAALVECGRCRQRSTFTYAAMRAGLRALGRVSITGKPEPVAV